MVGDHRVAGPHRQVVADLAHAQAERAEVHRNMRRIDHQTTPGIEQGAGKIETIPYVGRQRGALEHLAHLGGQCAEAMGEQRQLHLGWAGLVPGLSRRLGAGWIGSRRWVGLGQESLSWIVCG